MNEKIVIDSCVTSRNNKRLSLDDESDMADKTFVEDCINRVTIEVTALR